jgi:hypothetical protein
MEWQQVIALGIVVITAMLFVFSRFRKRKGFFKKGGTCGCSAGGSAQPGASITFHTRKGQRPEVIVRPAEHSLRPRGS